MLILQNVITNIELASQFATIKDIVADTIDVIVSASKGTLDINKATTYYYQLFRMKMKAKMIKFSLSLDKEIIMLHSILFHQSDVL